MTHSYHIVQANLLPKKAISPAFTHAWTEHCTMLCCVHFESSTFPPRAETPPFPLHATFGCEACPEPQHNHFRILPGRPWPLAMQRWVIVTSYCTTMCWLHVCWGTPVPRSHTSARPRAKCTPHIGRIRVHRGQNCRNCAFFRRST